MSPIWKSVDYHLPLFMKISDIQIYNEEIRDLLGDARQKLDVKEHPEQVMK